LIGVNIRQDPPSLPAFLFLEKRRQRQEGAPGIHPSIVSSSFWQARNLEHLPGKGERD